jgi:hypothetical protein
MGGVSPYSVVGPGRAFAWEWPLYYPLPAILVTCPMAMMSLRDGMAFFTALSSGAFAFAITRDGWRRVPLLASAPLAYAVGLVQWSPLLTAAALVPSLGLLLVTKPSIGLAIWLYRPTLRALVGGLFLLLVSIAIWPTWIAEWLTALESAHHMVLPIVHRGGPLLALALLRWRRPEARLLLALACVPQTALLYEVVPLLLIPATLVESLAFTVLSWITLLVWTHLEHPALYGNLTLSSARLVVPLLYLPCLVMVLRRPNEGRLPSWIEQLGVRLGSA